MAQDDKYMAQLSLIKLPPASSLVPPIELKFDIDDSGCIHVITRDKETGIEQEIVIPTSGCHSQGEIETMVTSHVERVLALDKHKKVEIKGVDQAVRITGGSGLRVSSKEPNDECEKLRREIMAFKEILTKKEIADPEDIRKATSLLHRASVKLSKMGYKRTYSERGPSSSSSCSSLSEQSEEPDDKTKDVKK